MHTTPAYVPAALTAGRLCLIDTSGTTISYFPEKLEPATTGVTVTHQTVQLTR